jgi:hypothetical protein
VDRFPSRGQEFSSPKKLTGPALGRQTPFQWVSGLKKRFEREADCAHSSNAGDKNESSYTSSPPIYLLKRQVSPELKEAVSGLNTKLFILTPLRGDSAAEKKLSKTCLKRNMVITDTCL